MTLPYIGQRPADNQLTLIGQHIRQIANPNWEMQLEMQRRMMADPSLVSQLAEVERNAPGTIAKLGFGKKLTNIISSTPETIQQKSKRELTDLQLQDARNNLEEFTMNKTKFNQEQTEREKKLKGIEQFKKFDVGAETENFIAGRPSKEFLAALAEAGPENQQVFGMHVQNLGQMRRLEQEHNLAMQRIGLQERIFGLREAASENRAMAREEAGYRKVLRQNAIDSYQKEKVGSVGAWEELLDVDSGAQERMQVLMKNPLEAKTQRDREILEIGTN
jgi:hypothetical protein